MTLREVAEVIHAEILTGGMNLELEPACGFGADLMSDVLAYALPRALLLTGLVNPQVIRTAEMADIVGILFVRGKRPPEETVELAKQVGIPLLRVDLTMFSASGKLYQAGLNGCDLRQ